MLAYGWIAGSNAAVISGMAWLFAESEYENSSVSKEEAPGSAAIFSMRISASTSEEIFL